MANCSCFLLCFALQIFLIMWGCFQYTLTFHSTKKYLHFPFHKNIPSLSLSQKYTFTFPFTKIYPHFPFHKNILSLFLSQKYTFTFPFTEIYLQFPFHENIPTLSLSQKCTSNFPFTRITFTFPSTKIYLHFPFHKNIPSLSLSQKHTFTLNTLSSHKKRMFLKIFLKSKVLHVYATAFKRFLEFAIASYLPAKTFPSH